MSDVGFEGPLPCMLCQKEVRVYGSRWCSECWFPSIDDNWTLYEAYREDGYSRSRALIEAGLADPPDPDRAS